MLKEEFKQMLAAMGPDFDGLAEALGNTAPEVSVRINPRKNREGEMPFASDDRVAWCDDGIYLPERPQFTLDPALHQGRYYVQDASSMSLKRIVSLLSRRLGGPLRLLDACAAPGGKTLCASDALPEGSFTVANEYDYRRAEILRENVVKWGASSRVAVSRGDTARFRRLTDTFDIVCVDAPCSGEGMMRKDATACEQWSSALIAECAARQREILENVWPSLRPGGFLIYSTCTFNTAENEETIAGFAADHGAKFEDSGLEEFPGVTGPQIPGVKAVRFLPGRTRGEGLFVSVIRKPGNEAGTPNELYDLRPARAERSPKGKKGGKPAQGPDLETPRRWIADPGMILQPQDSAVVAVPSRHAAFADALRRELDLISCGTETAVLKGRDLVPSHDLAMAAPALLRPDAFPTAEADRETALRYLRREAVTLPAETPRGIVLLFYGGYPLGFVKNIGNRANNLYPQQWRILKSL